MSDRPTGNLVRCETHGVYHRDDEPCALCAEGAPAASAIPGDAVVAEESRFPFRLVMLAIVAGTLGLIFWKQGGSGDVGGETAVQSGVREVRPGLVALARFESRVRRIETALFEDTTEMYDIWHAVESGSVDLMTMMESERTPKGRQAFLEMTAFVANTGNMMDMGAMDLDGLRREWAQTRDVVFGDVDWFHDVPGASENTITGFFEGDVTPERVTALRAWAGEVRRILNLGMTQAGRIGEVDVSGQGTAAANRTLAEWDSWTRRWQVSMNELRSQAPPMPSASGQGVREYINLRQSISRVINRMERVGNDGFSYQVPSVRQRQAYFDQAAESYAELAAGFRTLEAAIGAR